MKYLKTLLSSILLLTGVLIGFSVSRTPIALATCDADEWCLVTTPNVSNQHSVLQEVFMIDDNNLWVVGWSETTGGSPVQTALAMRTTNGGTSWSTTSMSISGAYSSSLYGVVALASNDVWAVGQYATSSTAADQTLIMHWTGSSWSQVSSPNPGDGDHVFNSVDAMSSTDIWAVGSYYDSGANYTLTAHWDNTSWSYEESPSPSATGHNVLYGVAAIDSDDVWASGITHDSQDIHTELLLHWDGDSWTRIDGASPIEGALTQLYKIGAVATDDVWTAGYINDYGAHFATLTEHWDGTSWSDVSSPNPGTNYNILWAIGPVESEAVWAVGYFNNNRTLTEFWDGTSWSHVTSPNVGTGINRLFGVSVTPSGTVVSGYNAWAVGFSTTAGGVKETLAIHYSHSGIASP